MNLKKRKQIINESLKEAGEMVQRLRTLALAEDPDSGPSTHAVMHNCSSSSVDLMPLPDLFWPLPACGGKTWLSTHIYIKLKRIVVVKEPD